MTLVALELLDDLEALGASVRLDAGELVIAARGPLPDELVERVRAGKAALLARLHVPAPIELEGFRDRLLGLCTTLGDAQRVLALDAADLSDVAEFWDTDEQLRAYIGILPA